MENHKWSQKLYEARITRAYKWQGSNVTIISIYYSKDCVIIFNARWIQTRTKSKDNGNDEVLQIYEQVQARFANKTKIAATVAMI